MKNTDRLGELEKIAEKLGIGQNREVECVSCHNKIMFKNAVILTNKEKVSYLCQECNKRLEEGKLTKQTIDEDELLKQLEKMRKEVTIQPTPYIPNQGDELPWKRIDEPYIQPYRIGDVTYTAYSMTNAPKQHDMLLKLEPNYADRTS